jgi:GNAT superfamily N-acetyltransferase
MNPGQFTTKNGETITLQKTQEFAPKYINNIFASNSDRRKVGEVTLKECSILWMGVEEKYQRQGIGSHLFKVALSDLKNQGCERATWYARTASMDFYLKQNADITDPWYDPFIEREVVRMSIPLNRPYS